MPPVNVKRRALLGARHESDADDEGQRTSASRFVRLSWTLLRPGRAKKRAPKNAGAGDPARSPDPDGAPGGRSLGLRTSKCERRSWTQFELRTSTSHFARFGTEAPPTFHSPICLWGPECGSLRLRIPSAGLVTSRFYNFVIAIEFKVLEHRCLSAGPTNLNPERRFPVGHAKENARVIL